MRWRERKSITLVTEGILHRDWMRSVCCSDYLIKHQPQAVWGPYSFGTTIQCSDFLVRHNRRRYEEPTHPLDWIRSVCCSYFLVKHRHRLYEEPIHPMDSFRIVCCGDFLIKHQPLGSMRILFIEAAIQCSDFLIRHQLPLWEAYSSPRLGQKCLPQWFDC